ncbi:MAG: hypothetical protein B0W54_23440 [Cellvibrio sp. 79]|nr:MAG: hypothetical protein B0W54_23440 [Cellvibrio sp. 79]
MKITQIRNATIILEICQGRILIDPMLARKSTLPKLRYYRSQERNPLVELPKAFEKLQSSIEYAMITHCQKGHFDHLDRAGIRWLLDNKIQTFCTPHDAAYLNKKGIHTNILIEKCSPFFDGTIEQVPAKHASGWLSPLMEHGTGYFIKLPKEPSLYLMGDTILTDEIRAFICANQPDYIIAPTGKAQFDLGAPILLDEADILELASISNGKIIANHMDALDHCRIKRADLAELISTHNLIAKFLIPKDGETITLPI